MGYLLFPALFRVLPRARLSFSFFDSKPKFSLIGYLQLDLLNRNRVSSTGLFE